MNDNTVINKLDNLRKLRENKKMTQLQLGMALGVTQELISRYEVGDSFPQPQMLIKLADYFHCSVDYLLGITDIPTPIKFINSNDLTNANIISKYNSLSNEDKKYFNRFLSFLLDNSSKE